VDKIYPLLIPVCPAADVAAAAAATSQRAFGKLWVRYDNKVEGGLISAYTGGYAMLMPRLHSAAATAATAAAATATTATAGTTAAAARTATTRTTTHAATISACIAASHSIATGAALAAIHTHTLRTAVAAHIPPAVAIF
jgi:hypothetical protein